MSRQFDVFANPSRRGLEERPYVVVIQHATWHRVATRLCVPLVDEQFIRPEGRLNPRFVIDRSTVYFHPFEIIAFPARLLKKPVANLEDDRYRIIGALDLVFTGI